MASTYAGRLKKGVHYGTCGLPEIFDSSREMLKNASSLAQLLKNSKHAVIFTVRLSRGCPDLVGVSTGAGIPDFRGPNGVWTQEQKREKAESANAKRSRTRAEPIPAVTREVSFEEAAPTLTHMAIVTLMKAGIVKFLISQNVDGLHIRSGVPVDSIAELHGNVFEEKCEKCGAVPFSVGFRLTLQNNYLSEEIQSISFQPTGRQCACGGIMRDTLLDWDDPLPEDAYALAEEQCERADLVLCLGTSLRVHPANSLPIIAVRKNRAKLIIVNLQRTPKDQYAHLTIRSRCDEVMQHVLQEMSLAPLPSTLAGPVSVRSRPVDASLSVTVTPPVGTRLPFVESVGLDNSEARISQQPFTLSVPIDEAQKTSLNLVLHLQKWCSKPTWPLTFEVSTSKEEENTVSVEYYRQPFETAPSTARMRSRDILVAAQDDPDKVFKKKRKAE